MDCYQKFISSLNKRFFLDIGDKNQISENATHGLRVSEFRASKKKLFKARFSATCNNIAGSDLTADTSALPFYGESKLINLIIVWR